MVTWNEQLSVGIDEIDNQHKQLLKIINELSESIDGPKSEALIGLTLMKLANFAKYHFATEEKYFLQYGYPEAEDHIKKHNDLVRDIQVFFDRFFNDSQDILAELISLLDKWLEDHLGNEDMKYAAYFRENNLIK